MTYLSKTSRFRSVRGCKDYARHVFAQGFLHKNFYDFRTTVMNWPSVPSLLESAILRLTQNLIKSRFALTANFDVFMYKCWWGKSSIQVLYIPVFFRSSLAHSLSTKVMISQMAFQRWAAPNQQTKNCTAVFDASYLGNRCIIQPVQNYVAASGLYTGHIKCPYLSTNTIVSTL